MTRSACFRLAWLLPCLLTFLPLFSQTITYELPDEFFVCDSAPFEVTVENTSGAILQNVVVEILFTTNSGTACGTAYLPGSVIGAAEQNISDLSAPVFSLPDLTVGQSATFTVEAAAPCSLVDCIDSGEFFNNEINITWNGGNTTTVTNPYVIERALLVITSVNSSFMSGSLDEVLQRNITIVNTRPGALQGFTFTDSHQGGIAISANIGNDISSGGNIFQIQLDGSDFTGIGDGDELFELNESIVIKESIRIIDCGVDITSTVSTVTADWGCDGNVCQAVSKNAVIDILPSQKVPELIWQPITQVSECFCGPEGYRQGMKITNIGQGAALDVVYSMGLLGHIPGGISPSSIVVDSANILLNIAPNPSAINDLPIPCDGSPDGVTNNFLITIPRIGPSQSVTIYWDMFFCEDGCASPRITWEYIWSYFKECPPSPFVQSDEPIGVSDKGLNINTLPTADTDGLMEDGGVYTATYNLWYDSLSVLNDELVVEIDVPCGAVWDNNNQLILSGHAPLSIEQEVFPEFTTITATYQLPFDSDSVSTMFDFTFLCENLCLPEEVCYDSILSTCEALDTCSIYIPRDIVIDITTTIVKCPEYPLTCNLQNCHKLILSHECPYDSICYREPPGYLSYRFRAARSNFGLPDNDNDRLADGFGVIDPTMIRRDRLIAGDTIHATLGGEIIMDIDGAVLPFGQVNMVFSPSNMQPFNAVPMITDGTGIIELGAHLQIFDLSTNSYYTCPDLPYSLTTVGGLAYNYDISDLGSCVPNGFVFEEGDSIFFEADYRMNHNIIRELDPTPLFGYLTLSPSIYLFDENAGEYELLSCGCETTIFEVSGYEYTILPGVFGLPPCGPSVFLGGSLFRLEMHEDNFFPFEYRNLVYADDWQVIIPSNIELLEAQMTFLRYQGGTVIANNEPLSPVFANGAYVMDFGQFQNPPLEEGFSALFQYKFDADCDLFGSHPIKLISNLTFNDGLPEDDNPLELTTTSNALRALVANLNLGAIPQNIISFSNRIQTSLIFENAETQVGPQSSGAAPNTWMYIESPSGLVTDFQIFDPVSGTFLPSVNGVFQFGDYPTGIAEFIFSATNNSCETEDLIIHFGWNCEPFTSQVQTPCYERTYAITANSPPGEIDFLVESPSGCFDLCDTIPYHTLQIFNGELGAVYDLTTSAQMPPGLTVLPGSSQVEYPSGSGNFYPINDPTIVNNTLAIWNLAEFDSLANGLPGVGFTPQNSVTLQYLLKSDCEFVAEAFTLFTIAAEQNCGIPTNTVAKPGDPICINGITQPYSTSIDVENVSNFGCADEVELEVTMTASQNLPAGACVLVTLPQGINYVPNSCSSACQVDFNCQPTVDGNTYIWQLPEGVPSNQVICFNFNTIGWSDLPCGTGNIIFRTANETLALCAESGDTCSTKVNTGSLIFPYEIERPEYNLDNFTVSASQIGGQDVVDFSIDIINCGVQNEPPITLDFYLDTDGDGAGDLLVHTQNEVAIISNCLSETMTGTFTIPTGNLCNLVAYVNPNQCACSIDSAYVVMPINYETGQDTTICSGDEIMVGVPNTPGFSYQWQPADCIQSPQQSLTVFSCENDGPNPITYDFVLAETDGDACTINNMVEVTVQPVPGIAFFESPICEGQEANLIATDGDTYLWTGPDVNDPAQQVQIVTPVITSVYSVTVTDAFNCMGMDMATVEVNPAPQVDAGDDQSVCPGMLVQLVATFSQNLDYLWSPALIGGSPTLNNPSIHNPIVLSEQDLTYTILVTDENSCTASDAVNVSFTGTLDLVVSPDITICIGSTTVLTASGADTYTWSPPGNCLNPECSSIQVGPSVTTIYTVTGSTADGCVDSAMVVVNATDDEIITTDTVEICEGQTAIIHGNEESEAGDYTFTTTLPAGCDSTSIVTLILNPIPEQTFIDTIICEGEGVEFQGIVLNETGDYTAVLVSENGCDSIVTLMLFVVDIEVEIVGTHVIVPDSTVMLSIQPSNFDSIVWSGGGMGEDCTNLPDCEDTPSDQTVYTVTVVDENGCMAQDTHLVNIQIDCFPEKAEVPNVFTPNGDGVNDSFSIVSLHFEQVDRMRIWDRWGRKIYDGQDPWDGTYNGKPVMSDIYIYQIIVGCPATVEGAEDNVIEGDVTLLR